MHEGWLSPSPLPAGDDLLAARELELGAPQGLRSHCAMLLTAAHREQHLADGDTGARALGLAERTAHACLEPGRDSGQMKKGHPV